MNLGLDKRDICWLSVLICLVEIGPDWMVYLFMVINLVLALMFEYTAYLRRRLERLKKEQTS